MTEDTKELRLYTRAEAAKALSISKDTLSKLISTGKLGFIMLGDRQMISYRAIIKYIDDNTVQYDRSLEDTQSTVDIESMRKQNRRPEIDTRSILKNIMEANNGKHI